MGLVYRLVDSLRINRWSQLGEQSRKHGNRAGELRGAFMRCCCALSLNGVGSIFFCFVWWLGFVQIQATNTPWATFQEGWFPAEIH